MKNSSIITNPIGLLKDFSELFADIDKLKTSSDNLLQNYQQCSGKDNLYFFADIPLASRFTISDLLTQNTTKAEVVSLTNEQFVRKYKEVFLLTVRLSSIYKGEDNEMSVLFRQMFLENKDTSLKIINELYLENISDSLFCVKLLSLCNDYTYKELFPTGQMLALVSINHQSDRVKSAAMNLFSHWGNKEAYKLLCSIDCPNKNWIQMKFNTIKKSLKRRWSI